MSVGSSEPPSDNGATQMLRYVIAIGALLGTSDALAETMWFCHLNKGGDINRFLVRDKSLIDLQFHDLFEPWLPKSAKETYGLGSTYQIINDTPDVTIALQSSVNFGKSSPLGVTIIFIDKRSGEFRLREISGSVTEDVKRKLTPDRTVSIDDDGQCRAQN
jgi:hypothetical protein